MTRRDDDLTDMTRDMTGDVTGSAQLAAFLADLRELGHEPAPPPQGRLAELLDGAAVPAAPRRGRSPYRVARRVAVLVAAAVAALVLAAANHTLPAPAQRVVTNVVDQLTPFHISSGTRNDSSVAPHSNPPIVPVPRGSDAPDRERVGSGSEGERSSDDGGAAVPAPGTPRVRGGAEDGPSDDAGSPPRSQRAVGGQGDAGQSDGGQSDGGQSDGGRSDGGSSGGGQSGSGETVDRGTGGGEAGDGGGRTGGSRTGGGGAGDS
jgi:hypothetical protein